MNRDARLRARVRVAAGLEPAYVGMENRSSEPKLVYHEINLVQTRQYKVGTSKINQLGGAY